MTHMKFIFGDSLAEGMISSPLDMETEDKLDMRREIFADQGNVVETFTCKSNLRGKFSCSSQEPQKTLDYGVSFNVTDGKVHMVLTESAGESIYLRLSN